MTATPEPYTTGQATIGHVEQQEIPVVYMPRADYLELVRQALDDTMDKTGVDLTDELMPVAETMDRFPLNEWLHRERGCGCLVGEYLVASKEIDRVKYVSSKGIVDKNGNTIADLVYLQPNGSALDAMGSRIDSLIVQRLFDRGCRTVEDDSEDNYYGDVQSVIFID